MLLNSFIFMQESNVNKWNPFFIVFINILNYFPFELNLY